MGGAWRHCDNWLALLHRHIVRIPHKPVVSRDGGFLLGEKQGRRFGPNETAPAGAKLGPDQQEEQCRRRHDPDLGMQPTDSH
jgi:hypothetical protein